MALSTGSDILGAGAIAGSAAGASPAELCCGRLARTNRRGRLSYFPAGGAPAPLPMLRTVEERDGPTFFYDGLAPLRMTVFFYPSPAFSLRNARSILHLREIRFNLIRDNIGCWRMWPNGLRGGLRNLECLPSGNIPKADMVRENNPGEVALLSPSKTETMKSVWISLAERLDRCLHYPTSPAFRCL
jgi:hypothetical protein